ncbi:MAG: fructose-1,6-bisphosphatase I [Limimaricola cinnabarinus]|jgi:fructose-1,6-bisphosphatase I|uniref:class 1 fructose-bisphosphatase n=1 Tax=Limimaricola cinnabarinus TaxID=1125964 RepID=UPI0039E552F5
MQSRKTLAQFLNEERFPHGADESLTRLLSDVATACKRIAVALQQAAFTGQHGSEGTQNVQGETQKKLDVIANDIFLECCEPGGTLCAMVSEEMEEIHLVPPHLPRGQYVLLFDPLDGSSNIDVNTSVGSIFSVLRARDDAPTLRSVLRPGVKQVCAGYVIYGPSTMLVLSLGHGVHGFTLDTEAGEFCLTHPEMTVPAETSEFAINAARLPLWEEPVRAYVEECLAGADGVRQRSFNMRWVASMVAEVHRILLRGGVFLYPMDRTLRESGGKLRLLYEANPMGFLIEQAGGMASTGRTRILEIAPEGPHQRVPVILGSACEVGRIVELHRKLEDAP